MTEPLPIKRRVGVNISVSKLVKNMSGRDYSNCGQRYGGSNTTFGEQLSTIHESERNHSKKRRINVSMPKNRDYSDCGASYGGSPLKKVSTDSYSPNLKGNFKINPETCAV